MGFRADCRAAACDLLRDFRDAGSKELQVYEGRPRSIQPPTAFVDRITESGIDYFGVSIVQRTVRAEVVLIHGTFDAKDTVAQADTFVDAFLDYVKSRVHHAGANSTIGVVSAEDDPTYVPDWLPPEQQRTYFSTRITLEGFLGTNT